MRRRPSSWTLVAAALALLGVGLRVWILSGPLGSLDADEAIGGLMARHALEGELSALYWLANYGGPQETWLAAALFAVFGSSTLALKLVPVGLFAVAAVLTWLVGRETVGEPAARVAGALVWVTSAYGVWWSTKARGYFGLGTVCALVVLWMALRLHRRDSRLDAALLGFALGVGFWANPEVLVVAVPALAWLAIRRGAAFRLAWIGVPAVLVGVWPWLAWNARNGWLSLDFGSVAGHETTYAGRFVDLFRYTLPTWLGLRVPYSLDWILGRVAGVALLVAALAGFALLLVRRPRPLEPLLLIALAFPFLYASSSFAFLITEPRYLVLVGPVLALIGAYGLTRLPVAAGAAAAAALVALTVAGLVELERHGLYRPTAQGERIPNDLRPLLDLLEREGADRVLADYWIAYRISFESKERIVATSTSFVRYEPHDRLVRESPRPAVVFVEGAEAERRRRPGLIERGYRRLAAGGFVAYVER